MVSSSFTTPFAKQSAPASSAERLSALDGLRALAIIWVAMFHFCSFWVPSGRGEPLLPYGDMLAWVPLASAGGLGVSLFFIVSGFVILMTLERTQSIQHFAIRRAARIFPTLILCGVITYLVVTLIGPERLKVSFGEFFFSLFALPPEHIGRLFGQSDWQWLDGAYWSLWVELRFYAVIGVLFFLMRKRWIQAWFAFQALGAALMVGYHVTDISALDRIGSLLFYEYIPLFSTGILAYLFHSRDTHEPWKTYAMVASFIHATLIALVFKSPETLTVTFVLGHLLIFVLFYGALMVPACQKYLSWPPLVRLGRASYSFYLLHQVIGVSILHFAGLYLPGWSVAVFVLPLVIVGLVILSFAIFQKHEQPANRYLVQRFAH